MALSGKSLRKGSKGLPVRSIEHPVLSHIGGIPFLHRKGGDLRTGFKGLLVDPGQRLRDRKDSLHLVGKRLFPQRAQSRRQRPDRHICQAIQAKPADLLHALRNRALVKIPASSPAEGVIFDLKKRLRQHQPVHFRIIR